jgi:hypothetical protein
MIPREYCRPIAAKTLVGARRDFRCPRIDLQTPALHPELEAALYRRGGLTDQIETDGPGFVRASLLKREIERREAAVFIWKIDVERTRRDAQAGLALPRGASLWPVLMLALISIYEFLRRPGLPLWPIDAELTHLG